MGDEQALRAIIADDHAATRAGARQALEQGGFTVCGEVADAYQAVELARSETPDVALLDIHMAGSGIWAAGVISHELPETAVVMLTASADDDDLFEALKAGARGYLLKDIDPERLPSALRGVLSGEAALPRPLAARLISYVQASAPQRPRRFASAPRFHLTDREFETLDLLRQGLSTAEVAAQLAVSPATVRSHVSQALRRLHVSSRTEAVAKVWEDR